MPGRHDSLKPDLAAGLRERVIPDFAYPAGNRGILKLSNAYPTYSTAQELVNWTSESLEDLATTLKDDVSSIKNSPYELLTDDAFNQPINYIYNGSNFIFYNVSYIMGYELV